MPRWSQTSLILAATALALIAAKPSRAVTVLLVTNANGTLNAGESLRKTGLEGLGYTVTTVWDNASQATFNTAVASAHAVYVPSTVSDAEVAFKLRTCTKGVVCEERYLDDNFGLATQPGWDTSSYTSITITNNTHYITSPFSTGNLTLFTSAQPMTLMNPTYAAGLQTLAEQNLGNKALAVVETGATLANTNGGNSTASGRRVHLPWGGDSFDVTSLNANAQLLAQRAIEWAIGDLVLHLKLNETSGTTANDSSIYDRDGTVTGSASWIPARRHNGFDFNGSTKVEVNSLLGSPSSFTVACWVRIDAADSSGADAVSIGDYIVVRAHDGASGTPQGRFYADSSTWRTVAGSSSMVGRGWHHFAVTFDDVANNLKLWIDGVNVATTSTTSSISWSGLGTSTRVGQHGNSSTAYDLDGAVDDVRVYRRALTASEIADVYGLVGHWKLVETAGTTATDSSGKALHGTHTGGPIVGQSGPYPGAGKYAAAFDGTNDYVAGGVAANYTFADGFSIAAWVNLDAYLNAAAMLQCGSTTDACQLAMSGAGRVRVAGRSSSGMKTHTSTAVIPRGKWAHVVGTYNGSTFVVYVDGSQASSANNAFTVVTGAGNLTLAASLEGTDQFLDGRMHDVRLYNRALAAEEVAELHGLVGRWKLDELAGTVADDASGVDNNGTYANSPTLGQQGPYLGVGQYAAQFDGANDHVVAGNIALDLSKGFAIAAWARPTSVTSNQRIADFGRGADVDNIFFGREGSTNNLRLGVRDGSSGDANLTASGALETNVWHHFIATGDSNGNGAIYRDGQLVASGSIGTPANVLRTANYLARSNSAGDAYFQGRLQDVRLYNRALSTAEVAELYGLVGHWTFDEAAGSSLADSTGTGNAASFQSGSPDWTTGIYNTALEFDGVMDDTITANLMTPPPIGTVALWFRSNGPPPARQRLWGVGSDFEMWQDPDGLVSCDVSTDGFQGGFITTTPLYAAGTWTHLVAIYDSGDDTYQIYINGQLHKSGVSTHAVVAQAAAKLSFGTRTGSTERFAGRLDDFRVYNRKLAPWEVYQIYGLMAWYQLDEPSGPTVVDATGRGNDGTLVGNPTLGATSNGNPAMGTAIDLSGADAIQIPSLYEQSASVSAAAWVRLDAADTLGADVVSLGDHFKLTLRNGSPGALAAYYNGSAWVSALGPQFTANVGWHHFAAVLRENESIKLYVDGNEAATLVLSGAISYAGLGANTWIGSHGNGGTSYDLDGRVDDVRIYNRAIQPEEVFQLYRGTRIDGIRILQWVEAR